LDNRPLRVGDVTFGIIGSTGPETASKNVGGGVSTWAFPGTDDDLKRGDASTCHLSVFASLDAGNPNRTDDHCVAQDGLATFQRHHRHGFCLGCRRDELGVVESQWFDGAPGEVS
jgi:hypothetical protein